MMYRSLIVALLALTSCTTTQVPPTPTPAATLTPAEALVERHFAARGGKGALEDLGVVCRTGELTFFSDDAEPVTGPYRTALNYGGSGAVFVSAGPARISKWLLGGVAWQCDDDFDACQEADAQTRDELIVTADEANRELLFELPAWTQARVEGTTIHAVLDGAPATYVFDPDTGLLASKTKGDRTRTYHEWRKVGGVAFPWRVEDSIHGKPLAIVKLEDMQVGEATDWCAARLAVAPLTLDVDGDGAADKVEYLPGPEAVRVTYADGRSVVIGGAGAPLVSGEIGEPGRDAESAPVFGWLYAWKAATRTGEHQEVGGMKFEVPDALGAAVWMSSRDVAVLLYQTRDGWTLLELGY